MPDPYLVLDHLTVRDRRRTLLDGLSLSLEQGRTLALLGPAGAGKTATLMLLAGFLRTTQGRIVLAGHDITAVPPERRDIALVFASDALFPHMSVLDNVAFALKMHGAGGDERRARAAAALADLGCAALAERPPARLNPAERRLVALARAAAARPALLLIDEPAVAQDTARFVAAMRKVLACHTAVLATHDRAAAFAMADHIAVLREGHLEQMGTPQQIYEQPMTNFVAGFTGGCNLLPASLLHERDGEAVIAVAGATAAAHCQPGLRPGPVTLCLRPHRLRLDPEGSVHGIVEQVDFQGAVTLVTLRVGAEMCVAETAHAVPSLAHGSTLAAGWDAGHAWLIPTEPG